MATRDAYYSDEDEASDGRYSEDFDSEDDRRSLTPRDPKYLYHNRVRGRGMGPRGRGRGQGVRARRGRGHSRNSEPADMRTSHDTITKRVLSASRNKVNELRNKVEELRLHVKELEQENKLYKKLQFRQEKAIRTFENKENDLPSILDKHNNEVRALKEQNRRLKEKYDKSDRYLRDAEDELEKAKKRLKKYKEMVEEKELLERDELSRKLTKAEIDMEEKDVKIKELNRHIEMLKKNHRHELGIEIARQKELKKQLEEHNDRSAKLESQLKDKERALEQTNLYSRPRPSSQETTPKAQQKLKKRAPSMTDLTPRDKAKFYEEKRRVELQKQKQLKAEQDKKRRQKWEAEEKQREKEREKSPSPRSQSSSPPLRTPPPEFNFSSIDRGLEEREMQMRKEEEDRKWRDRENRERQQREEMERKKKELERRQEEDRRRKEEEDKVRREREQLERREREDRERREKEERERKERLERERREKEKAEQERRLQQEREKLDNDPNLLEERRKKDELLRKLQAMDQIGNNPPAATTSTTPATKTAPAIDPFAPSPPLGGSKENSHGGMSADAFSTSSKRSEPKEYSFTKPINNLHAGKPSHDMPYYPRSKRNSRDDELGGYQPSFTAGTSTKGGNKVASPPKPKSLSLFDDDSVFKSNTNTNHASNGDKKSSNLLENLFGPQSSTNKPSGRKGENNDTFFITDKSPTPGNKHGNTTTTFPWDNTSSAVKSTTNRSSVASEQKGNSTLFSGGAALIDDAISPSNNRVLPRRGRQQNLSTFSSKPSVKAVDNTFDDDLEEVVL